MAAFPSLPAWLKNLWPGHRPTRPAAMPEIVSGMTGRTPEVPSTSRVVLPFIAFGVLWIVGSDRLLDALFEDRALLLRLQSGKGLVFVLLSAWLIHALVRHSQRLAAHQRDELRAERDRLAQILRVSPTLIYSLRPDADALGNWHIDHIGDNVERITGHSRAAWLGSPDFLRRHIHPDDLARYDMAQRQLMLDGELHHEYRFRHGDGQLHWIDDQLRVMFDVQGAPRHIVGAWMDVTERKQAELALREAATRYQELFEINPWPMWVYDLETLHFESVNQAAIAAYGYSREDFHKMTIAHIRPVADQLRLLERIETLRQTQEPYSNSGEWRHRRKDGSLFWVELSGHTFERDGRRMRLVLAKDVSDRHRADEQLRLIAQVFQLSHEGIFITDARGRFIAVNQSFAEITGYGPDEVRGHTPAMLKSGRQNQAFYAAMWAQLLQEGRWEGEIWNRRKSGEVYPEWLSVSAIRDVNGRTERYLGIFTDTSARKAADARIAHLQSHDALTGLPNAVLLADRAQVAFASAMRNRTAVAVLHVNIDHFGAINESYGHETGDALLKTLAARLVAAVAPEDTVSRRGADDFIVLLSGSHTQDLSQRALRLKDSVAEEVFVGEQGFHLVASIGIAEYPADGAELSPLLQAAESAVQQAKREGGDRLGFYSRASQEQVRESLALERALRQAQGRDELRLHYQGQFDALTGRLVGAEALLRWQHPELGLVSPARFIPIAESSGLIRPIGLWVLHEALGQLARWREAGLPLVPVAVNLSLAQFRDPALRDHVITALRQHGLAANLLELELTESIAMEDSEHTIATVDGLKRLGVSLSIDDFGTGYSSLSYLKRLSVDRLKIDQSFVRGLRFDPDDEAIVRSVISLARSLGLRTLAEGVETEEQLSFLRDEGCQEIQGYLKARPVPADDFAVLLRQAMAEPAEPVTELVTEPVVVPATPIQPRS
ncbi:sensor domain-containing protein [Leptothrix discophora]|uniref:EAL domain-containing protein n=1 Tax=Leptothrix discophora TaxID=89 RepID=A0ABT9G6V1_LEPDI|nr:bifunctional diguanylate cyclase/phosphodiesterase [Leptothrix discophora]MDP4302210.1 EAL domain-containing protein [Leptothrix discophora]